MAVHRNQSVTAADGARLLLDHHEPGRKAAPLGAVVWIRTPYGRKGIGSIAKRFATAGAHVIVEALRGTDGSGGEFAPFDVQADDAGAVLAWLRQQSWFPGVIATWGLSAIGYASWALTDLDVPEWRLAILQDAPSELRDGLVYPGGAFAGKVMLGFLGGIEWQRAHWNASLPRTMLASVRAARRTGKVLAELPLGGADERLVGHRVDYFQQWLTREHDEAFWTRLDRRRGAAGMAPTVYLATGWYDVCLAGTLADYRALRAAGKTVRLTVGPWYHGRGTTDKQLQADMHAWLRAAAAGTTPPEGPPVRVHVGGIAGWRDLPDWPPPGAEPAVWHLHPGGVLSGDSPSPGPADRYRYDPADPTPQVGGAVENFDGSAGAKDNSTRESRPDVLTYTGDPLEHDLEIIGPVRATIVFRSSSEHTDVLARVCDVHPDGTSINVADGARRLRANDPPARDDGTRIVEIDLAGIAQVFRTGHRIRLQISSGAHPRLVRNTGTGQPLASATTLRAAEQEVFHDPEHPSALTVTAARSTSQDAISGP